MDTGIEKYYVPGIEEFHVGFEFEFETGDKGWKAFVFRKDRADRLLSNVEEFSSQFRVKYLDAADIEECGFCLLTEEQKKEFAKFRAGGDCFLMIKGENVKRTVLLEIFSNTSVIIRIRPEGALRGYNAGFQERVSLRIKNKSELKRLMKQLGIWE